MPSAAAFNAAAAGLALGLSLIVAIGAQNAFVLRQGLRGEHLAAVVAICVGSDAALIAAGVAGAGALIAAEPALLDVVRVAGAAFLLTYGALAARRAVGGARLDRGRRRSGVARRHRVHRPGADLAEPARLPGHGRPARLDRRHARRRAVVVRRGRRHREPGVVHRPRLRRTPAAPPVRAPGRMARARRGDRRRDDRPRRGAVGQRSDMTLDIPHGLGRRRWRRVAARCAVTAWLVGGGGC